MQLPDDIALPMLRPDIQLNEAPPEPEGAPTWTLYDPSANKYYKIGWLEFECLSRFNSSGTAKTLCDIVARETPLHPEMEEVAALVNFLMMNNLVVTAGEGVSGHYETMREKREKPLWMHVLHGYLFFTLPLFRPQRFLEKTLPYVRFMLTRSFMTGALCLLAYGIFLSLQRFDELTTTFMSYFSFEGVILFLVATFVVKFFHELGHAYVATKYGVPVTTMGVAFIVMYPVLYTETTNAWKLRSRRDRAYIALAGVMTETVLASVALVMWHILEPGLAQSLCFMIAVVSLAASLAVNLNPLMRFDGYYIFSELVGVDNLQDRSFAFARWKMRRFLWGWNDPAPEALPQERADFMAGFGFAIWVYRFFLYSGIALVVYHLFFQPLGLCLMLVEYGFFIALPVLREIKVWYDRRTEIPRASKGIMALGGLLFVLLLAFMPLERAVEIPAVLHAGSYTRLYAPIPARVDAVLVNEGQRVETGDILFSLSSPDLEFNIDLVKERLQALQDVRDSSQATLPLAQKRVTIDSEIEKTRQELRGFIAVRDQLTVRAEFSGIVRDLDETLRPGRWIGRQDLLALLVDDSRPVLSGYVRERDVTRIHEGGKGTFYPEYAVSARYDVTLDDVEPVRVNEIYWPELSSVHNGPVPSERAGEGLIKAVPRHVYYPVRFEMKPDVPQAALPDFIARGTVRVEAAPASTAKMLFKKALSVIIREGGF